MSASKLAVFSLVLGLFMGQANIATAGECKQSSAQGWGLTEELAKWQATDLLLFSTGNWIVQNDRFSKPSHNCKLTLLGWTCTTTAKICKK